MPRTLRGSGTSLPGVRRQGLACRVVGGEERLDGELRHGDVEGLSFEAGDEVLAVLGQ